MPPHPALSPETAVRERWGEECVTARGSFGGEGTYSERSPKGFDSGWTTRSAGWQYDLQAGHFS